eukprot:GILI01056936.1.p1 GENE.GILI01056936.1~~GILI01056936.1.p1  ORF type:complete len:177 (-),score=1.93 GILI01056936.1:56-508(-)
MTVDNKGQSSLIGAATSYYGLAGGDGCYDISTTGAKNLIFSGATSSSTTANSTRVQFTVPGNGIVNFATGSNTYEILALSANSMTLRTIGADGNAWFTKLKVKLYHYPLFQNYGFDNWCIANAGIVGLGDPMINNNNCGVIKALFLFSCH